MCTITKRAFHPLDVAFCEDAYGKDERPLDETQSRNVLTQQEMDRDGVGPLLPPCDGRKESVGRERSRAGDTRS